MFFGIRESRSHIILMIYGQGNPQGRLNNQIKWSVKIVTYLQNLKKKNGNKDLLIPNNKAYA